MILFAHHGELQHLPVLAVFLGVGVWVGWRLMSGLLNLFRRPSSTPTEQ